MPKLRVRNSLKVIFLSLFLIALFSISLGTVFAESINGNHVIVESGETLEKTSFLSGNNIRIDGDINGTTFAAASRVEVNGTIDGDLFVAAQRITINGTVKGSIFTAAQNIDVNGSVDNNIYSAGDTLKLQSETDGSAFLAGRNIYLEDEAIINRDMFVGGANVYQAGVINGDLNSSSESLEVSGTIAGDLNYLSNQEANLSNDSEITGETNWKKVEPKAPKTPTYLFTLFGVLFSILTALLVWLVVRLIRPDFWNGLADKILSQPLKTFGFGTLAFFLLPIVGFFLMLTIIGIPLSFILLAIYVISLYVAKIILASSIAFWFQKKYHWSNGVSFWLFLLSLIILSLLVIVPFMGWVVRFIIAVFGLGAIVLSLRKKKTIVTPESQNFN